MSVTRLATVTRTAAVAAFVGLAVAGGAGLAAAQAPAHTTVKDDTFLHTLDKQGITYDSASSAVSAGHYVCSSFDSGSTFAGVAREVLEKSSLSKIGRASCRERVSYHV